MSHNPNVYDALATCAQSAKDDIDYQASQIIKIYEENKGKPVATFIEKVFTWRKNPEHYQVLYSMFEHYAFTLYQSDFLARFYSFVANLLDDTYYFIRWERPKLTVNGKNLDFVYDGSLRLVMEPCPVNSFRGGPVVHTSGEGSQDFQALIDAVEAEIARREAKAKRIERGE